LPCYHPIAAFQTVDGQVVFSERRYFDISRSLSLPCGQCVGCRLERSRQWAMRCLHEAQLHEKNCFITLTYNDEHLPRNRSLDHRDFQLFMKKLRKKFGYCRFYMCGEYGEKFDRPHFHAILFGIDFSDRKYHKTTSSGSKLYRSSELEKLWTNGFSSVGDVTFESSAYVARYIMKKINNEDSPLYGKYIFTDLETGEIVKRKLEYNKMSLKPKVKGDPGGIGAEWFMKFKSDVYPHDYVIINGRKVRPPKYYDLQYEKSNPYEWEEVQFKREQSAKKNFEDNTDDRLLVKETITKARVSLLKRSLA
jgi:hypothetical protein